MSEKLLIKSFLRNFFKKAAEGVGGSRHAVDRQIRAQNFP